jgi:hypothetical protein
MPLYRSTGKLTGTIEPENVAAAQEYLDEPMAQYLDPPLQGVVEVLTWTLDGNGRDYRVDAFALRELTEAELKKLAEEVTGQNSDGLGEGFEQQAFAEEETECGECGGCEAGWGCDEPGNMISFDWKTNDSAFTRVV